MHIPRLLIAGTHSGAGKTSVATALMAAYSSQGHTVLPYKAGPDYIDPAFHSFILGRPSHNLDAWLLPEDAIRNIFRQETERAVQKPQAKPFIAVIEGVMGLFDGQGTGPEGSSAQLAGILKAPVILVLNAKGISRSAAALVQGYNNFMPGLRLAGVICNRVSGVRHYELLRDIIETQAGVACLGYLPANPAFGLKSRHLGLVPAEEVTDLRERIQTMADAAGKYIDLERLFSLAEAAEPLPGPAEAASLLHGSGEPPDSTDISLKRAHLSKDAPVPLRIGLARDAAFSFYYQANLDLLQTLGVQLVPFSPLHDARLPEKLHGLYLGGGFPEQFADRLAANATMRSSLRQALEAGLPCYAECGGLLYLTQSLRIGIPDGSQGKRPDSMNAETYPMAGFFPCRSIMETRLQRFGYATVTLREDCLLGLAGTSFRAHEFHYSRLEWDAGQGGTDSVYEQNAASPVYKEMWHPGSVDSAPVPAPGFMGETFHPVYDVHKADGRTWTGGLMKKNTLGVYPHIHFYSRPDLTASFINTCRRHAVTPSSCEDRVLS